MRKSLTTVLLLTIVFILFTSSGESESIKIDVPYFAQGKDTPWADETLGAESAVTIRTHGCALTSISMVYSYHTDKNLTPSIMNTWLRKNNGFMDAWEGGTYLGRIILNWPSLAAYDGGWVYTRADWKDRAADLHLIRYYLDNGIPVIAEVVYRSAAHYIVLKGYDTEGFIMNDPEFPDEQRFNNLYNISDDWGSGAARNINGIRVLYPADKNDG